MRILHFFTTCALAICSTLAGTAPRSISGDYLEVRSCDVYTGPCFANSEMGLTGKEGMLFWSVREGSWKGVDLGGLSILAVVKADGTLGNLKYQPRSGEAILIVDDKADESQKAALTDFARQMSGSLIEHVVEVKTAPIDSSLGTCSKKGCASVTAGNLVEISTSCLSSKHDVCGNEETFYPPLSNVQGAYPVFTELAAYTGSGLDLTWQISGKRSAYLGVFSTDATPTQVALR
ncbi:MAG TPA: DUF1326 domain-containing protein [Verrucomicrobiae bacterium]|nr:DUF1326 domain-containing protein [Verrucomicrobiae bacterium]